MDDYRRHPAVAFSDVKNFRKSKELYRAVKEGSYRVIVTAPMKEGTIRHAGVLTPDEFFDQYYIQEAALHPKQQEFVENIIAAKETHGGVTEQMVEDIYESIYTKPKKGDGKKLFDKLKDHIKNIYEKKEAITMSAWKAIEKSRLIIDLNPAAKSLLETMHIREDEIIFTYKDVECKSKIDAYGIKEDLKKVIIGDLKVLMMPASEEEIRKKAEEGDWAGQLTYYETAIKCADFDQLYENFSEYQFEKYILALDPVSVRVYKISDETSRLRLEKIHETLEEIKEEMKNESWVTTKIFEI